MKNRFLNIYCNFYCDSSVHIHLLAALFLVPEYEKFFVTS